jgi:hypothetical protein
LDVGVDGLEGVVVVVDVGVDVDGVRRLGDAVDDDGGERSLGEVVDAVVVVVVLVAIVGGSGIGGLGYWSSGYWIPVLPDGNG